jgi:DNA modification methylase
VPQRRPPRTRRREQTAARAPGKRRRRALSHVGGTTRVTGGTAAERSALVAALDVTSKEAAVMAHVHGFHSYPARLHPGTAERLISTLSSPRARILDPFCGSGTVLVEARLSGRRTVGVDRNPLAIELSWLKTFGFSPEQIDRLREAGSRAVESAEDRRVRKAGPSQRYGRQDRELFDIHVLLELDGLRASIERVGARSTRRALALVLSSTLTKLSRRPGDTSSRRLQRRLASGFAIRLFAKKLAETCRRLEEFARRVPRAAARTQLHLGDARALSRVQSASVDLVVTSPPYPGVYDYYEHHAARLRWLGLNASTLQRGEIGARRKLATLPYATASSRYRRELGQCLGEMRRVLVPGGKAALVLGDSAIAGKAIRIDEVVAEAAPAVGLNASAIASQARPHFHAASARAFAHEPRRELVVLLQE